MERVLYKCRKNTHALLLLMAALLFVRMSDNVNVAAAARKMKTEDVDVNNDDNSPVPAAPPSESEPAPAPAPALAPEPEPEPAPAPAPAPSEPAPALAPEPQPATTTVTFFMHDVVGGSNPTAKPLSMSGGSTTLIYPNGLIPPITSGGGLLNGGPLPLTFPSAAILQSPLLNTQFPATSVNPNGFISSGSPSFLNGVGPTIPTATGAGLLNPLLQNGPVLPLTFPNGFVPSSSTNPLLNGIGINGQNLQFNQFPAALNFPFTSQQGIPLVNSPNLLNPLPNSPFPGAGTLGAAPLPLNQQSGQGQGLGSSSSEVIVIEDPLTEGPDESSGLMGKGMGYYMASPKDPKILLMTFTAKFEEGSEYEGSTIDFSGEDNTALPEREIAVVGGSGKFEGAKGHAVMETVSNTADETVLKFIVNLTY